MTTAPISTTLPRAIAAGPSRPLSRIESIKLHTLARLARWRRWEFWPAAIIYAPLLPYLLFLALRHRALTTPTAANTCMPMGGLVGESKWSVLSKLPPEFTVPSALIEPGALPTRLAALDAAVASLNLTYPIVLKPDVGERGSGVRLIRNRDAAALYLAREPRAVLAQAHHPGPREAGIFYTRAPDEATGRIFSITDKRFPLLTPDGRSTLRELILRHPRFRMQASTFLARLGPRADEVPPAAPPNRPVRLAFAGNHCQGTMFLDGESLITPPLTTAVDRIARSIPGFHFGRFDVRYADETAFKQGAGGLRGSFAIVELNGVLSESTNIYDPSRGFWSAQRTLRAQWRRAFEIGAANRRAGVKPAPALAVLRTLITHTGRESDRGAD